MPLVGMAVLCLVLGFSGIGGLNAADADAEYRLKAALMYKMTKFVQWPEVETDDSTAGFVLCMLGRDPFGAALDPILQRQVNGKPIVSRMLSGPADAAQCDMAYLSTDGLARYPGALRQLSSEGVLTVSDQRGFASQGGMVELARRGRRLVFRVNRSVAAQAGIHFAAPFLEIAVLVGE